MQKRAHFSQSALAYLLVIGGVAGLGAATTLTIEKFALLENPAHQLSCSINPVLSCGSVMLSDQASAFGFPNPFLGIAAFSVLVTIGMALFAGAQFKRWFWQGLQFGTLFGIGFVHWLIYQSLYSIGALCLYCIIVWIVTWPIFWYVSLYNLREGHLKTPGSLQSAVRFAQRHHADILIAWYVLVLGLILHAFWHYWKTVI